LKTWDLLNLVLCVCSLLCGGMECFLHISNCCREYVAPLMDYSVSQPSFGPWHMNCETSVYRTVLCTNTCAC